MNFITTSTGLLLYYTTCKTDRIKQVMINESGYNSSVHIPEKWAEGQQLV